MITADVRVGTAVEGYNSRLVDSVNNFGINHILLLKIIEGTHYSFFIKNCLFFSLNTTFLKEVKYCSGNIHEIKFSDKKSVKGI